MGCCVSTIETEKKAATKPAATSSSTKASPQNCNAFLEEETVVKEVLSETPSRFKTENVLHHQPIKKATPLSPLTKLEDQKHAQNGFYKKPKMVYAAASDEDASEICSSTLSESVSTATENLECVYSYDHDDVSKFRHRSPAKHRNRQVPGEGTAGKSPARRSPGRIGPGSGRDGGANGNLQRSDRRSRSPVTRMDGPGARTGLGRCPSGRGLGKTPGRVGSEMGGRNRKGEDVGNREHQLAATTSNELLENPQVSLECFIFL